MKKYESLKNDYPEYISLNQLYQICKIAKRSALYLIKNGIIPCVENNANKTWRYKISIDDVITYLRQREQWGSMIPKCLIKNGCKAKKKTKNPTPLLLSRKTEAQNYFTELFSDQPDILSIADIISITGLCSPTVKKLVKNGGLETITHNNTIIIPKTCFIKLMCTEHFVNVKSGSENFNKIINGFDEWIITCKM